MSDEEKKAIEILKYVKNKTPFIFWYDNKPYNRKETINIVLNLIERQQKEIEEFKEKNKKYTIHFTDKQYEDAIKLAQSVAISMFEDKIKAKIDEVKEEKEHYLEINDEYNAQICDCIIEEYESLLEKE